MKLKGLHEKKNNLVRMPTEEKQRAVSLSRSKRMGFSRRDADRRRRSNAFRGARPKKSDASRILSSLTEVRARSHRDDFAQHPQAVTKETNFASFSVIPADRNFPNAQSGALGEKKQLNIERKTIHLRRLQNRPANIELKRFEPALGVPKWQAGCDAHKKIENTDRLARAARVDGLRSSCDPKRANQKQYQLRRLQSVR